MDLEGLDQLGLSIWADMQESGFSPDCCVAAARIGIDVLRELGYRGKPLPVTFNAMNQELVGLLMAEVPMDTIAAIQTPKDQPGGPWWLTIGEVTSNSQGAGHVIIHIPELRALLDISAPQGSRPHKAILITEPIVVSLDADQELVPGRAVEVAADLGVRAWYDITDRHLYKLSPNWARKSDSPDLEAVFPEITARQIAKFAHLRKAS